MFSTTGQYLGGYRNLGEISSTDHSNLAAGESDFQQWITARRDVVESKSSRGRPKKMSAAVEEATLAHIQSALAAHYPFNFHDVADFVAAETNNTVQLTKWDVCRLVQKCRTSNTQYSIIERDDLFGKKKRKRDPDVAPTMRKSSKQQQQQQQQQQQKTNTNINTNGLEELNRNFLQSVAELDMPGNLLLAMCIIPILSSRSSSSSSTTTTSTTREDYPTNHPYQQEAESMLLTVTASGIILPVQLIHHSGSDSGRDITAEHLTTYINEVLSPYMRDFPHSSALLLLESSPIFTLTDFTHKITSINVTAKLLPHAELNPLRVDDFAHSLQQRMEQEQRAAPSLTSAQILNSMLSQVHPTQIQDLFHRCGYRWIAPHSLLDLLGSDHLYPVTAAAAAEYLPPNPLLDMNTRTATMPGSSAPTSSTQLLDDLVASMVTDFR